MLKSPYSGNVRIRIPGQGQEKKAGGAVWWAGPGLGRVPGVTVWPEHGGHNLSGEMSTLERVTCSVHCVSHSALGCCAVKCQFFFTQKVTIFINLCNQENHFCSVQPRCLFSRVYRSSSECPHHPTPWDVGGVFPLFLFFSLVFSGACRLSLKRGWECNAEMTVTWGEGWGHREGERGQEEQSVDILCHCSLSALKLVTKF